MATTADFRNGLCIVFKDDLYTIVQFQHVKPGKGPAFVRTKLRNVKTGRILENTFTSGVKIDTARIERRPYQFLYKEGEDYVMMHTETFEQVNIPEELINAHFRKLLFQYPDRIVFGSIIGHDNPAQTGIGVFNHRRQKLTE